MSIAWTTVRSGLEDLIADLSGGLQVTHFDKRRPFVDPGDTVSVYLKIRGVEGLGVDDRRYANDESAAPANNLTESVNGLRVITLEVRVEAYDHDDSAFAFVTSERIRDSLNWSSSLNTLRSLGLALASIGRTQDLPNVMQDQRIISTAVFEARLNAAVFLEDTDPDHTDNTIETVVPLEYTGEPA